MANGEAKVTLLIEMKERIRGALGKAKSFVNDNVREIKEKLGSLKESHIQAFNAMKSEVPGFGRAIELATNPYVLMTAAVVGLGMAFTNASAKAATFDSAMAKANVTAQESRPELRKTGNFILDQAANSDYKGAANAAPEAYNILLSSGMDKKTALAGVNPTLDAAKAGFTDLATVARAAANSMNSSGIKDTTRIYDILFATLNKGNAEFGDIANYLPKIIPAAKNVGLNMEQVAGSFAFLTAQGLKSEQAATGLENVFKVLGDPDKVTNFKNIGVAIYDNAGKIKPFKDIVTQLDGALQGLTDKQKGTVLSSLGLDMEAAGTLSIMAQNAGELGKNIDFVTNSSGQFKTAVESAKTPLDSWNQIGNMIDVAFIKVGQTINNIILSPLGEWIVNNKENFLIFGEVLAGVVITWGIYSVATNLAAIGTGIMTAAQWALNAAMSANPIGIIVTTIGLLVGGLIAAYKHSQTFRAVLSGLMEVAKLVGDVFAGLGNIIAGAFTLDANQIKKGMVQAASAAVEIANGGIAKAYQKGFNGTIYNEKVAQIREAIDKENKGLAGSKNLNTGGGKKTTTDGGTDNSGNKKSEGTAIKGAEQVRNITTNIDTIIRGDFITKNEQFSNMSPADFQRFLIETLTRYTKGQELGLN